MDLRHLISHEAPPYTDQQPSGEGQQHHPRYHHYPTRQSVSAHNSPAIDQHSITPPDLQAFVSNVSDVPHNNIPITPLPKNVAFELLFDGATNYRARLPMRVQIFPHDTTESIVTTVKNFYGLYAGGVSFEDDQGNTLIASYDNFQNNMVVHVRVIADYSQHSGYPRESPKHTGSPVSSHQCPQLGEAIQMPPPQPAQRMNSLQPPSRPGSRVSRKRSPSPHWKKSGRSNSLPKGRSQSGAKSRGSSVLGVHDEVNNDAVNGYSSSDGGAGSVTSSRKAKSEQVSADISTNNIVEGNRRFKRAKFESSELPLFVPPQVPAPHSISSVSPQRRSNGQDNPSPFARPMQPSLVFPSMQSPQSQGYTNQNNHHSQPTFAVPTSVQHGHRLRDRSNASYGSSRVPLSGAPRPHGSGILPTPDPTVASCISDEDVALQLMRLGDASNFSHGRTSASTLDDALSGRADAASSVTSDSDDVSDATEKRTSLPPLRGLPKPGSLPTTTSQSKRLRKNPTDAHHSDSLEPSTDEVDGDYTYDDKKDGVFRSDPDDLTNEFGEVVKSKSSRPKLAASGATKARRSSTTQKISKPTKPRSTSTNKKAKPSSFSVSSKPPMTPNSLPSQSRKTSTTSTLNFQHQLGVDEEDLSSKPRCQRCRKSKKGCNRQRPCQRCKDAGIGIEGCLSEDEGSNRKGRYGRHMGVPVKKGMEGYVEGNDSQTASANLSSLTGGQGNSDKNKKRKR